MDESLLEASYVVAGDRPFLVVEGPGPADRPLSEETDPILWAFSRYGLKLLPGFYGVNLPDGVPLEFRREAGELRLVATEGPLAIGEPLDDLPDLWLSTLEAQGAAILLVGRGIGFSEAPTARGITDAIDTAARAARVLGAVVEYRLLPFA